MCSATRGEQLLIHSPNTLFFHLEAVAHQCVAGLSRRPNTAWFQPQCLFRGGMLLRCLESRAQKESVSLAQRGAGLVAYAQSSG